MLTIDPEFQSLIPPLAPEELAQLEANILADGCRDPLVVWLPNDTKCEECGGAIDFANKEWRRNDFDEAHEEYWTAQCQECDMDYMEDDLDHVLIDGHNRYAICTKHGLPFETVAKEFAGRAEARIWMRGNQMGRRNLNPGWRIELNKGMKADLLVVGSKRHEATLPQKGEKGFRSVLSLNDKALEPVNTQKEIAKAAGVSTGQVAMAEQIMKKAPDLWEKVKADEVSISTAYKQINVHVGHNSGENEWYTPSEYIEAARATMGTIDCDPASSAKANETVNAATYFDKEADGLTKEWDGNVWMNPPYAQPLMAQFAEAIAYKFESGEINQAVALVNNATETAWFQRMARASCAICFPTSRIKFIDQNGKASGAPLQGQAVLYMGDNAELFARNFSTFGIICYVIR